MPVVSERTSARFLMPDAFSREPPSAISLPSAHTERTGTETASFSPFRSMMMPRSFITVCVLSALMSPWVRSITESLTWRQKSQPEMIRSPRMTQAEMRRKRMTG